MGQEVNTTGKEGCSRPHAIVKAACKQIIWAQGAGSVPAFFRKWLCWQGSELSSSHALLALSSLQILTSCQVPESGRCP